MFAYATTRLGGVSKPPFESFNLGTHVGDESDSVAYNRSLLPDAENIYWLQQVHGNKVIQAGNTDVQADGSFTRSRGIVCAVMTADCLPILLCDKHATVVAAVHAGWRGLANGIVENAVAKLGGSPDNLIAWIGPSISQRHFEVQQEVIDVFADYPAFFRLSENPQRFLIDLGAIAKSKLEQTGVTKVFVSGYCTYGRNELFYSHRRASHQGLNQTGRIVTAICLRNEF